MHTSRTDLPQITSPIRSVGAFAMLAGAFLYFIDAGERSWHLFTWPAIVLMGFGAVDAAMGWA